MGADANQHRADASANEARACPYPSFAPPVRIRLVATGEHPCVYVPGRTATNRALLASEVDPEIYHQFMDANFRRSGEVLYQPICNGCRLCRQIRVPVALFKPGKTQRRCWRRNEDVIVTEGELELTEEKLQLYRKYVTRWHSAQDEPAMVDLERFLYVSPVRTMEYVYRNGAGKLMGVGICDHSKQALSTVYFFHDPDESERSLGTYAALWEIERARQLGIQYYYLGFWVQGCRTMQYKAAFRPNEVLDADGIWRPADD